MLKLNPISPDVPKKELNAAAKEIYSRARTKTRCIPLDEGKEAAKYPNLPADAVKEIASRINNFTELSTQRDALELQIEKQKEFIQRLKHPDGHLLNDIQVTHKEWDARYSIIHSSKFPSRLPSNLDKLPTKEELKAGLDQQKKDLKEVEAEIKIVKKSIKNPL